MYQAAGGNGSAGGSGGGFQPTDNPCLTLYNDFINSTPVITRLSILGLFFAWVFSWFFNLDSMLGNITYFSFGHFEVYRLVVSPLVGNSFFSILMLMLFYPAMGTRMEYSLGSAGFLALLVTLSLTINVVFNALCFILYMIGVKGSLLMNCCGFFNIIFALLTIECQRNPEAPRMILCLPFPIQSKYFPFVFFLVFTLLGGPQLDLAVGIIVGIWYAAGSLDCLKLSSTYLAQLEGGILHSLTDLHLWISTSGAMGFQAYEPTGYYDSGGGGVGGLFGSSSSSSAATSAPQFPGHGNVTGYSSSSSSSLSSSQTAIPIAEAFPGSGNRIGSAAPATFPTATAISSFPQLGVVPPPSLPPSSVSIAGQPSREEIAAKRLAALTRSQTSPSTGESGGGGDESNV